MGLPVISRQFLKRSKRWSILPAYSLEGYIAYKIYQGSIITAIYNDFIYNRVLPQCSQDGVSKHSVLVIDNAKIHHSEELRAMCAEANVKLE